MCVCIIWSKGRINLNWHHSPAPTFWSASKYGTLMDTDGHWIWAWKPGAKSIASITTWRRIWCFGGFECCESCWDADKCLELRTEKLGCPVLNGNEMLPAQVSKQVQSPISIQWMRGTQYFGVALCQPRAGSTFSCTAVGRCLSASRFMIILDHMILEYSWQLCLNDSKHVFIVCGN